MKIPVIAKKLYEVCWEEHVGQSREYVLGKIEGVLEGLVAQRKLIVIDELTLPGEPSLSEDKEVSQMIEITKEQESLAIDESLKDAEKMVEALGPRTFIACSLDREIAKKVLGSMILHGRYREKGMSFDEVGVFVAERVLAKEKSGGEGGKET